MSTHSKSKDKDGFGDDGLIFLNDEGHSMHFVLLMNDSTERDKLKKKIENRLGCVHTSVEDIGPHTLVLTDNANNCWKHDKIERFQIGYISECFSRSKISDVNKFVWETSNIHKRNFDYNDVVYDRVYSWDTIPDRFIIKSRDGEEIHSKSDTDSDDSFTKTNFEPQPKKERKNTRHPYSRSEKEAIIKYIVDRKLYDRVKGNEIWKELERLNICPIRSWQSMKEHTIKAVPKEINSYHFLTPKQREKLYNALTKPRPR